MYVHLFCKYPGKTETMQCFEKNQNKNIMAVKQKQQQKHCIGP